MQEGPFFTIGEKVEPRRAPEGPGVGAYSPVSKAVRPSSGNVKFGTQARTREVRPSDAPGPGQYGQLYMPPSEKGGFTFTKESKEQKIKGETPGPGSYRLPTKFADVPDYLIPGQSDNQKFV